MRRKETREQYGKIWNSSDYQKAQKRVNSMSIHDVLGWADDASVKMGKAFYDYSNERDETVRAAILADLARAVSTMQAAVIFLMDREDLLQ